MPETTIPAWALAARAHKERWSRECDPDHAPSFLLLEDDDGPLALVFLLAEDREEEMKFIQSAIYGLAPTAVVLAHDALAAERDPAYGDELQPGDLGRIAARGGRDRGQVVDAMVAVRCDRSGRTECCLMPYRDERGGIAWLEAPDNGTAAFGGFYPESLSHLMRRKETAFAVARARADPAIFAGVDEATLLRHCRRATLDFLAHRGMVVLPLAPGLGDIRGPES